MDNRDMAKGLVKMAKDLVAEEEQKINKGDFIKIVNGINVLRDKFNPSSEEGIFLSIVRDMAIHTRRGSGAKVKSLAKEMITQFGT